MYTVADWRSSVYDTFHSKWLDYQVHGIIMGDYCAPARGTMEIMCPEGHIMPPEGGIMQPEGGIMFPEGLHDFHWPEGRAQ